MKALFFSLTFAMSLSASAEIAQKSKDALTTEWRAGEFKAQLKSGFHFNEKAPNKVMIDDTAFKPTRLEKSEIVFSQLPKKPKKAQASLFVCDDDLTTCEMHSIALAGSQDKKVKVEEKKPGVLNRHGFIEDDLQQALALAAKKNSLILIDFAARWCPSCVRLENEIFGDDDFKKMTKNFVKVKIDTDRFENTVISDKYHIVGIPTLLVINSKQEEIDRITDYQPMIRFKEFFAFVQAEPTPISQLLARKNMDGHTRIELGRRLLGASRVQEAFDLYDQMDPKPPEWLGAKVALAEENLRKTQDKKAYVTILKEVLDKESQSTRSLQWRTALAENTDKDEERKKIVAEGVMLADQLLDDPAQLQKAIETDQVGEFTGLEAFMVAIERAELIEAGEKGNENETTVAAWRKAANIGATAKITAKKQGSALRYLVILTQAHLWMEADSLARELISRYPENVDLHRRRLRILFELKKYDEGIKVGKSCLKQSYGRNEFWVAELLAKTYLAAQKKKEARQLIDRYLSRAEIDWANLKSSKQKFEDLKKQIN